MTTDHPIPMAIAGQLQRLTAPALLINVPAAEIVWANAAGRDIWQLDEPDSHGHWQIERSSHAINRLTSIVRQARNGKEPASRQNDVAGAIAAPDPTASELLKFQTSSGVKAINCQCYAIDAMPPGHMLVTALDQTGRASDHQGAEPEARQDSPNGMMSWKDLASRPPAANSRRPKILVADDLVEDEMPESHPVLAGAPDNTADSGGAAPDSSDTATLQEIARRIRNSSNDRAGRPPVLRVVSNDGVRGGDAPDPNALGHNSQGSTAASTGVPSVDAAEFLAVARSQSSSAALAGAPRPVIAVATDVAASMNEAGPSAEDEPDRDLTLAALAHELRTPISAIKTAASILVEGRFGPIDNERYRAYVSDIEQSAAHSLDVITALLVAPERESGARSTARMSLERLGDSSLTFTQLNLAGLAHATLSTVEPLADNARITLINALDNKLPQVIADARSVRQMLINLLANAIRFTPPNGRITLTGHHDSTGSVTLEVRDTGPGMSNAEITAIMAGNGDPAAPQDSSSGNGMGHGMGLALTMAMARSNGAALHLSTPENSGLCARLIFSKDRVVPV